MIQKFPKRFIRPARAIIAISLLQAAAVMGNPFFAFDNGLGKKSPAEQAALLKELGYDGIGYTGTGNFALRKKAFTVALHLSYWHNSISQDLQRLDRAG